MLEIWFILLTYTIFTSAEVPSSIVPNLVPGFSFDYSKPGQQLLIPVTEQCETIHLSWSPQSSPGFNATAPFFLHVYTSQYTTPFVINAGAGPTFDWQVPFSPGTQYQVCMFDNSGVSGSCQAIYTVIPNSTWIRPTCNNITAPNTLDVIATECGRQLPQFGYLAQCGNVVVSPKSGQPPYVLTVTPSMHPPYNITSNSRDDIVWAATLTPGSLFFITLSSADGLKWTNGPMHVGGPGEDWCFAPDLDNIPRSHAKNLAAAAGFGSAVAGLLLGIALTFFWLRRRRKYEGDADQPPPQYEEPLATIQSPSQVHLLPNATTSDPSSSSNSPSLSSRLYTHTATTLTRSLTNSRRRRERERLAVDPFTSPTQPSRPTKLPSGEVSATSTEPSASVITVPEVPRIPADLVPLRHPVTNEKR